jgi:glucan phosphoethanolaminetransferase (alkaline phosphatase superfamily)
MNYIIRLIIFIIIIIVCLSIYYIYTYNTILNKGWECVEGDCELIVNGNHKTKKECEKQCKLKK